MSFDEKFSRKISLAEAFKYAWEIFSGATPKLFVMLAALVIPAHLIYNYVMRGFTAGGTQSMSTGLSFLMSPLLLLVNLAVLDLLYGVTARDEVLVIGSFFNALKKWFKSILTMLLAFVFLFAPVLVISIPFSILARILTGGSSVNIGVVVMMIILAGLGIASFVYMFYLSISFIFMPMAVLVRDRWLVAALKHSKRLVKTRWWFCLLLLIIMIFLPAVFAVTAHKLSANFFIILLFTIISAVITSFFNALYIIYFLNFEKLNELPSVE